MIFSRKPLIFNAISIYLEEQMQQKPIALLSNIIPQFLLIVSILIFSIPAQQIYGNDNVLVGQIRINQTKVKEIKTNQDNQRYIHLQENEDPQCITIELDTAIISQLGLTEFRYYIANSDAKNTPWVQHINKDFVFAKQGMATINIESRNAQEEIFTDSISITIPTPASSNNFTWIIYALLLIGLALVILFWSDYRISRERFELEKEINHRTHELSDQKAKYEKILTNYLPKEEFEKLKDKDKTVRFKMVTVLFSNILGFTKIAEQEDAEQLIDDLDRFVFEFDGVVKKLHIEKLKAVGDSYLCAGGIPQKNRTNPIEVVLAAFEMQQYMEVLKNQYKSVNKKIWDLRMGIHTGPVFSNATPNKKRLEVWGDSVNIASRMEASGEIGKVNISGMTYELVKDYFLCQYRGKMPVKYKGDIDMYFIEGFRPALSVDGFGLKANQTFITSLGLIRFDDLEEHVMNILEDQLPKNLYYHNLKHTIDVTVQVELIGREEGITNEQLLILKTAALFHDCGFTRTYKDHEEAGFAMAKEILPDYDYTPEQIEEIGEIIMATKMPPEPKNHLQQIICDADLDYLGRVDFIPVSGNLFRELTEHKIIEDDINRWNQIQIDFIDKHSYFTNTAKKLRDVNKNNQLEAIRRLVEENS